LECRLELWDCLVERPQGQGAKTTTAATAAVPGWMPCIHRVRSVISINTSGTLLLFVLVPDLDSIRRMCICPTLCVVCVASVWVAVWSGHPLRMGLRHMMTHQTRNERLLIGTAPPWNAPLVVWARYLETPRGTLDVLREASQSSRSQSGVLSRARLGALSQQLPRRRAREVLRYMYSMRNRQRS
jgi:hypothetical protein